MQPLSLYELNGLVRQTLELTMADTYWLQAEVAEIRESRGHCYLEFVQKEQNGNAIIAKSRATIWARKWLLMRRYFERTTGQVLSAGMSVLVAVTVNFHEAYGFSLNVEDIDPTYTLGDIARRRQEILQKLKDEGVDNMNKLLPLPRLMNRIAVISSATAAGYGDFCNQLQNNTYGLAFKVQLFASAMQGDGVESGVICALNKIASQMDDWDVVVIIRGGGSTTDLSGFDTLALAENVAQFPLPIITGIGHERDDTVIDMVANTRVKTPTAAAEFLIQHQKAELDMLDDASYIISTKAMAMVQNEKMRFASITDRLDSSCKLRIANECNRCLHLESVASNAVKYQISTQRMRTEQVAMRLDSVARLYLERKNSRIQLLENKFADSDPRRILKLGFSIVRVNDHAVSDAAKLKKGDVLKVQFHQGETTAEVL